MKIERINDNKIKVMIDSDEAREWNITVKNISQNTPEVQKMFWRAIGMAKESVDFTIDGANLFVETIPHGDDGIGMLITKVRSEREIKEAVNGCAYKGKLRTAELKRLPDSARGTHKYIYRFASFEDVCMASKEICRYRGISTLYKMDNFYYLYLASSDTVSVCEAEILLSEFADKESNSMYVHGKLSECGTMMIEGNAVEVVNKYFS